MKRINFLLSIVMLLAMATGCRKSQEVSEIDQLGRNQLMDGISNTDVPQDPPSEGCTLTQGYWGNHTNHTTWSLLPGGLGQNSVFFLSGQTFNQVLNTPVSGNAYYILAQQYIAAKLNFLNGATSDAAAQAAFNSATSLFNTYTPAQIASLPGNSNLRKSFVALAGTLDEYNNGLRGPGHCD